MSELRVEYERGKNLFVSQIDWLIKNGFNSIRRTRGHSISLHFLKDRRLIDMCCSLGDGDCFYRCDV
jgi:hypothetical protein